MIFLFLLCGNAQSSFAQNLHSFKGTVESLGNQPVFAADILLKSTETEKIIAYTATDSSGKFQIEGFPKNYVLEVHLLAFQTFRDTIYISGNQKNRFKITLSPKSGNRLCKSFNWR